MVKTASLTSGLVAVKGQAAPAVTHVHAPRTIGRQTGPDYYKSMTVKLDRDRYESLKNLGLKFDKKSQQIFTEALDLWIQKESASAVTKQ